MLRGAMTESPQAPWSDFRQELRGYLLRRVQEPADADDVLQDVFERLQRRPEDLAQANNPSAWLYSVTRNALIDHARRAAARERSLGRLRTELDTTGREGSGTEDLGPASVLARCLRPMIHELPARDRQALEWVELEGLTQREAAERAGISVSGMKARVQRARRRLRERILACCAVDLDARGGVIGFAPRGETESKRRTREACDTCEPTPLETGGRRS